MAGAPAPEPPKEVAMKQRRIPSWGILVFAGVVLTGAPRAEAGLGAWLQATWEKLKGSDTEEAGSKAADAITNAKRREDIEVGAAESAIAGLVASFFEKIE